MALYRTLSVFLALAGVAFAATAAFGTTRHPELAKKLPRARVAGTILGALVLAYCAYEGGQLLPGTRWGAFFYALVPIVTVLSYFFLDFLMARAFGGLLIVLANYVIQHAFAYHCGCRPLFAIAALCWGCLGIAFLAWPWWTRDFFAYCEKHSGPRLACFGIAVVLALLLIVLPVTG